MNENRSARSSYRKGIEYHRPRMMGWTTYCLLAAILFMCNTPLVSTGTWDYSRLTQDQLIKKIAKQERVDPKLVKAMVHTESSGRPEVISCKGAVGLMQVMPSTAEFLDLPHTVQELKHPEVNLIVGCRILKYYRGRTKNLSKALFRYSGGSKDYARIVLKRRQAVIL